MDSKGKERGILKLEPRPRVVVDTAKAELTPQGSCEYPPSSPQPSVDRLSVTWAEPGSMSSSGVNLFHLPSETPLSNEVKFSPAAGAKAISKSGLEMKTTQGGQQASDTTIPKGGFKREGGSASSSRPVASEPRSTEASSSAAGLPPRTVPEEHQDELGVPEDQETLTSLAKVALADGSEDEDYSASLSAVLRQRRASVRRSRKGRSRRPSSPFLGDENRSRRRSSVFTTSSGDTAISMEEPVVVVTQEQIFENIHLHKEVLGSVKQQPLGMRRKLKIVHQAKGYIKRHQGQLQERLAQSKSTRDIYARFNILLNTKWQQMKREAANTSNLLIPWELRIKEIESHFGSVVASYFTFLRWLFWVNLVIAFILLVFVIVPECLTADPMNDGERKLIMEDEQQNASNLLTVWEFDGVLKFSPIFYGYYSNIESVKYRMPLAYFLTGLAVYVYSFVAILRKMAENSRMSKLSEKEDECIFSWKLFTGWDFMIGNTETAHNRIASVILGFKEALLEEAEKKKDLRNWRTISLRTLVNICVIILLTVSAYAVVTVVSRSDDSTKVSSWLRENETTIVVTLISITFPFFFELLGYLEHYHPRNQLRLQLARIMLLNLLNLYSLIFALFSKIDGMSKDLDTLKPMLNATISNGTNISEALTGPCFEEEVPCEICNVEIMVPIILSDGVTINTTATNTFSFVCTALKIIKKQTRSRRQQDRFEYTTTENALKKTLTTSQLGYDQLKKIIQLINQQQKNVSLDNEDPDDYEYSFYDTETTTDVTDTSTDISSFSYPSTIVDNSAETISTETSYGTETDISTTEYTDKTFSFYDITDTTDTITDIDPNTDTTYYSTSFSPYEVTTYKIESTQETVSEYVRTETFTTVRDKITDADTTDISTSLYNTEEYTIDTTTPLVTTESDFNTENKSKDTSTSMLPPEETSKICSNMSCNSTVTCNGKFITQVFFISNCTAVVKICYKKTCGRSDECDDVNIAKDIAYIDDKNIKRYNLTIPTRKKLLKLCWETMFGQELVKLTMMDLVFVLLGTLFLDFFRALLVRYLNRCWCWDLEKKFPEYGDFKIAENILHLINNQGMVWMGMFFSPGLVVLNVAKLMIMMYLRSWAVMTCNVPHEVVFRVSKSNNFYLALLLTMLFLCVLPVGYTIVWVKPSWHCGPFSEYDKIYRILITYINKLLPNSLHFFLEYIASPAIVIPMLVLLILIIYYLTSLTNSLREANNDLKIQLRRERTEERRKMFQLADTRRRAGSSSMENTPFARWKKALPTLPMSKSIDSDDRKTLTEETNEPAKTVKKRGGIFAKIVGMALDKKPDVEIVPEVDFSTDDKTDTDFHETLPKEVLKLKDISIIKSEQKKRNSVEFKTDANKKHKTEDKGLKVKHDKADDRTEKKAIIEKQIQDAKIGPKPKVVDELPKDKNKSKKFQEKQASESSTQSRQSDSTVIPVITISTTESDEEVLSKRDKESGHKEKDKIKQKSEGKPRRTPDLKSLRRQSSVESINEQKSPIKEKKQEEGPKYQYSL